MEADLQNQKVAAELLANPDCAGPIPWLDMWLITPTVVFALRLVPTSVGLHSTDHHPELLLTGMDAGYHGMSSTLNVQYSTPVCSY